MLNYKTSLVIAISSISLLAFAGQPKPSDAWAKANCPNYYHSHDPSDVYFWSITLASSTSAKFGNISANPSNAIAHDTSDPNTLWLFGCYGHQEQVSNFAIAITGDNLKNCQVTGSIVGANGWPTQTNQPQLSSSCKGLSLTEKTDQNLVIQ